MLYFENSKNRNILALLFTCFALLESIFFGFAIEELYSFMYPFMLDILTVFIIACLCYFLDFKRKMNSLFIFIGSFAAALFSELCFLYFRYGSETGFYRIPSIEFLKAFSITLLVHILCLVIYGLLKIKYPINKILYLIPVAIYFIYSVLTKDLIQSILICLTFIIAFYFLDHLKGKNCKILTKYIILLFTLYIVCLVVYFSYKDGILLTQEASSFVNILIILAGIILLLFSKRYGLYLIEFISFYMSLPYLYVSIKDSSMRYNLIGIFPLMLLGFCSLLINHLIDTVNSKEEV